MPMETTVTIAGNLGTDPSLMRTENGPSRAYFRVAVTPRVRHPEKGWVDSPTTTWYSVTCWRALADHAKASLRKGDPVFVHGRMRSDTWTDQNGVVHETLAVEATCVGHDLSRGVSRFFRASQPSEEARPRGVPRRVRAGGRRVVAGGAGAARTRRRRRPADRCRLTRSGDEAARPVSDRPGRRGEGGFGGPISRG